MASKTPQERRNSRLTNDYSEMVNIKGEIIDWEVLNGSPPHVEKYKVKVFNIKTITGPGPSYNFNHEIEIELPSDYPRTAPIAKITSNPLPFHPNWYDSGLWCAGRWNLAEGLGHFVIRLIRTLQFDDDITNPASPANRSANNWYESNLDSGYFPCDNTVLPDPTKKKMEFKNVRKKFDINENEDLGSKRKKFDIN